MLFTNIQLDDFQPTCAHSLEWLIIEGAEEREWIMMAIVNVTSVLELANLRAFFVGWEPSADVNQLVVSSPKTRCTRRELDGR